MAMVPPVLAARAPVEFLAGSGSAAGTLGRAAPDNGSEIRGAVAEANPHFTNSLRPDLGDEVMVYSFRAAF